MNRLRILPALLLLACTAEETSGPKVRTTTALGPLTGHGAKLHPDNRVPEPIAYYGTDLGFSYLHEGRIHFLFGDTWATEAYAPIEASTGSRHDDGFGTIDPNLWPDPAAISPQNMPLIRLGQNPGTTEMSAMDPGHAMDLGKTPMAGFSNGEREFAIFNITKPKGCLNDRDCANGLGCDVGLGFVGTPYDEEENLTLPCLDGGNFCQADTIVDPDGVPVGGSGFCSDPGSTIWADAPAGRIGAVGIRQRVSLRSLQDPRNYALIHEWLTNRFLNVTATVVDRFEPAGGSASVLLWGRPGFVGVNASGRTLGLYFAYAELPEAPDFAWRVRYYTGTVDGVPQFSALEQDAVPADLDSTRAGIQPVEVHDIVHQMSVEWIAPLKKWVMFYGGGISTLPKAGLPDCGLLQLFANVECSAVAVGNGAIRMRTADQPWGPWSPPQDVIAGGDPEVPGSGQYGEGGMLRHPACMASACAPHSNTPFYDPGEYGFFYSANIIEEWVKPVGDGVDILWNASTWDPYRVVLLRTRIDPE